MSKNYAILIRFVLPLTTFYLSGAQKSNVYKRDLFVTSWRFHNRAWQPQRHDHLPETSGTLWIHRAALANQRCSLATGCGISHQMVMVMNDCHPLCAMSIGPPILIYSYFKIWPWKSMVKVMCVVKVKVMFDLQNSKVKVMVKVKPICHIWGLGVQSICLLLASWQSDHFWLRYSKFYIWSWKFKVKIMAKVKPDNHIWALEFNRYVCFSFRGNRTIFGWDMANSIFEFTVLLQISRFMD